MRPNHYKLGELEPLDLMKLNKQDYYGFCKNNAIKYLLRFPQKNGVEDLEKAKFYLNEIKELKMKIKNKMLEEEKQILFELINNMQIENKIKQIISILIYAIIQNKTDEFDYAIDIIILHQK